MADEVEFCGDRLRLTAFLRYVETLPDRPARSRGRLAHTHPQHAAEKPLLPSPQVLPSASRFEVTPTSSAINLQPPLQQAHTARLEVGEQSLLPLPADATLPDEHSPALPIGVDSYPYDQRGINIDSTHSGTFAWLLANSRQQHQVYQSRAGVATGGTRELLKTRKRKRLPVKGLVLVRTTTEDGLPEPSDQEAAVTQAITVTDPIEDTQTALPPRRNIPVAVPNKQPNSTSNACCAFLLQSSKGSSSNFKFGSSTHQRGRLTAFQNCARVGLQIPLRKMVGWDATCDGFVGDELALPLRPRKQQKTKHAGEKKTSHVLLSRGLELATGFLPSTPTSRGITGQRRPSVGILQMQPSQDLPNAELITPNDVQAVGNTTTSAAADSQRAPASQHCRSEQAISNQLSSITAPARQDSDSESFASDDEDKEEHEGTETWYQPDTILDTESSRDSIISGWAYSAIEGPAGEVSYLGDAMNDVSLASSDDGFWAQYGGLD